jgi:hypothetical protein
MKRGKKPRRRKVKALIRTSEKKKKNRRKKRGRREPRREIRKRTSARKKRKTKKTRKMRRERAVSKKPVYALDTDFEFFYELRDLILKSSPAEKDKMVEKLNKIGRIKLAIISGVFINKENLDPLVTDLFIVGDDIDRRKLRAFLKAVEAEVGKEIKFAVMDKDEFQYRLAMFDRFIRVLLEGPHEKLIDRLGL